MEKVVKVEKVVEQAGRGGGMAKPRKMVRRGKRRQQ